MDKKVKTIGVLTSGGDAPGMNAAVRSIARTALHSGIRVKGIYKGFAGLLANQMEDLTLRSVSNKLQSGGTFLFSARCPEFKDDKGVEHGKFNCIAAGIDGLIVCGGDGSFRGARDLSLKGIPCIGVPCTIDNDIACSDYTIGFDTAVNTVLQSIDRLRDTSQSHDRCSVVEVMGRNCGDIALHSAVCCGAVSVLIPEIEFDLQRDVIEKMRRTLHTGKNHFIVIVSEGVTNKRGSDGKLLTASRIAKYIEKEAGVESRVTVIGHVQRGGSPSARDRVVASQMGYYAATLLKQGIGNRVVAMKDNKVVDYDILEGLAMTKEVDEELFRVANEVSI